MVKLKRESQYIQGICVICDKNKQTKRGIDPKTGNPIYRNVCSSCFRRSKGIPIGRKKLTHQFRKTICEACGFIPIHICQLDVDHIDGNHDNNNSDNFRTLCANCHRLKTFLNKDWENK